MAWSYVSFQMYMLWTLVLIASIVHCEATQTATWSLGMRLSIFFADESNSCPATLTEALDTDLWQFYATTTLSAGPTVPSGATSLFYLTNGWHTLGTSFDSNAYTSVRVAEPVGVAGGCWELNAGSSIDILSCDGSSNQTFYVDSLSPYSAGFLQDTILDTPIPPSQANSQVTFGPSGNYTCIFDADTGNFVTAPSGSSPSHFATEALTNLTDVTIPGPDTPTSEHGLPGCVTGATYHPDIVDCAVARAVNGVPAGCDTSPDSRACILHFFPAFCIDLPSVRNGLNASTEVESCIRSISLGPCVANPGGAACLSGKFQGIQFMTSSGGSVSAQKRDDLGPLFGGQSPSLPAEDEFWIGAMKNLINQGLSFVNLFTNEVVQKSQIGCLAATQISGAFSADVASNIRAGCQELFKLHNATVPLDYDNNIQKAGGIFAEVVSFLVPVVDAVKSVESIGLVRELVAKFSLQAAPTDVLKEGFFLEATEQGNSVRVFRDFGDGTPSPLVSEIDQVAMKHSLEESGFESCTVCVGGVGKRAHQKQVRQAGSVNLCCVTISEVEERPETAWSDTSDSESGFSDSDDEDIVDEEGSAIPVVEEVRTIGALTQTAGLASDEVTLLTDMRSSFSSFFVDKTDLPLTTDPITEAFYNARYVTKVDTSQTAITLYGNTASEAQAILSWADYVIEDDLVNGCVFLSCYPALESGTNQRIPNSLAQLDGTTGLCFRTTGLNADTLKMLQTGAAGVQSQGAAGIYEVRDLLKVKSFMGEVVEEGQVMASTLGLRSEFDTAAQYRFVINSKTGRYIEPFFDPLAKMSEVDFIQGWSQFKLLGWEEVNGGEAAKLAGKQGPFGVF